MKPQMTKVSVTKLGFFEKLKRLMGEYDGAYSESPEQPVKAETKDEPVKAETVPAVTEPTKDTVAQAPEGGEGKYDGNYSAEKEKITIEQDSSDAFIDNLCKMMDDYKKAKATSKEEPVKAETPKTEPETPVVKEQAPEGGEGKYDGNYSAKAQSADNDDGLDFIKALHPNRNMAKTPSKVGSMFKAAQAEYEEQMKKFTQQKS